MARAGTADAPVSAVLPAPSDPAGEHIGGVHIVIEGERSRPAVALVHGIPGSVRDFRYLAPALVERGLCAVRIDMPGFGTTAAPVFPAARMVDRAAFVHSVMRALGFTRFACAGHSYGGGVALSAAALYPDSISALACINSIGPRRHRGFGIPASAYRAIAQALRVPALASRVTPFMQARYAARGLRSDMPLTAEVLALHASLVGAVSFKELRQLAARVQAPTLVVSAEDDALVEPASSFALSRAFARAPLTSHLHAKRGGHFCQKHESRAIAHWLAQTLAPAHAFAPG